LAVEPKPRRSSFTLDEAANCRNRAEEAWTIANKLSEPLDKAAWLKVAEEWINRAEAAAVGSPQRKNEIDT
jgi:hypothetical protein